MARERVVRLVGTDAEIRAAAVLASAVIAEDPERARRLFPGIGRLGYDRRAYLRALAHPGAGSGSAAGDEAQNSRRGSAAWGVIVGVGLVGVLISAAVFAPPIRGFHADPELGIPAAAIGSIVALAALTHNGPAPPSLEDRRLLRTSLRRSGGGAHGPGRHLSRTRRTRERGHDRDRDPAHCLVRRDRSATRAAARSRSGAALSLARRVHRRPALQGRLRLIRGRRAG